MPKPIKDLNTREREELIVAIRVWQLCLWRKFPWDDKIIRSNLRVDVDRLSAQLHALLLKWRPKMHQSYAAGKKGRPDWSKEIYYTVSAYSRPMRRRLRVEQIHGWTQALKKLTKKPLPSPFLKPTKRRRPKAE